MATIDTPHTIQEIIAREFDKFELKESAFNAGDRKERAAALGLPLSLIGTIGRPAVRHRPHPNLSPPSTGA